MLFQTIKSNFPNPFSSNLTNFFPKEDTKTLGDVDVMEEEIEERGLIVFNDDHNSFEHVIDTLIEVCKHGELQAEQCTLIIHHKGKCIVKYGSYETLEPMCQAICDRGISAEIA